MISLTDNFILEENEVYFGNTIDKLMKNASREIARVINLRSSSAPVVFFCGSGNNGGDGFAAATFLKNPCTIYFVGSVDKLKPTARAYYQKALRLKRVKMVTSLSSSDVPKNAILVDCLMGTGFSGKPRGTMRSAILLFNRLSGYKYSVDIPSANMVRCNELIAIHDVKKGTRHKGRVTVVDIGFSAMDKVGVGEVKVVMAKRLPDAHKGQAGKVAVVGGHSDYVGAVTLAGLAALRSGVDWVSVVCPQKVGWAINALSPDLVVRKLKGDEFCTSDVSSVLSYLKGYDAVLLGNGIGTEAKDFCKSFVSRFKKRCLVIDADGIKAVSLKDVRGAVFTPHVKELEILLSNSGLERLNKIKDVSKKVKMIQPHLRDNVIVLKGKVDIIFSKDRVKYNYSGNPGMSKAGTGDVLAGLVVGFLGQSSDLFNSACAGAFVNGCVGDLLLKKRKVYSFIASDIVSDIARVVKKLVR